MDNTNDAIIRAEIYHFLASIYLAPPTREVIDVLQKREVTEFLSFASDETKKLVRDAIQSETELSDLTQEFMNLFVVPLAQYTTPFEAVFLDEREVAGKKVQGLLMGPSTVAVIESYKRAGAMKLAKELPDHIGCELAFMEYLCNEEALTLKGGKEGEAGFFHEEGKKFLANHLIRWMPDLAEKIAQKAKLNWYKALANVTLNYIRYDLASLNKEIIN